MCHESDRQNSATRAEAFVRIFVSSVISHAGLLLFNRYQLDEPIGRGSLCTVYRGSDTVLRRSVAVKAIKPELVESYRDIMGVTAELTHPAAIATYDALEYDGWLFLVQEYVTARPLSAYLRDGLPTERTLDLAGQVTRALAYAHTHGIAHGDLTPASVLVDRHAVARINNFGSPPDAEYFERCRREWPVEDGGEVPPEWQTGFAGDVQAVGYLLWQLLSEPHRVEGQNGGDGSTRREFRGDVPDALRECVRRCVSASGSEPSMTAEALVTELESLARKLAEARPPATEHTPPALRAARDIVAREAAWSAEETLGGVRYWGEGGTSDSYAPSAPTDRAPLNAAWHGPAPAAELTPRLRLPSRPVDDAVYSALRDFAASPMAASPALGYEHAARTMPAAAAAPQGEQSTGGGWSVSFALVVVLGIALFLLFFIVGYFSSRLFGIG